MLRFSHRRSPSCAVLEPLPDPSFRVTRLHAYDRPQTAVWHGLKQDYSPSPVDLRNPPPESECGNIAVKALLKGNKGHFGPLEHPQITYNVVNFPHSVMQQARTHRVGVSFDVQSTRYTGQQVVDYIDACSSVREFIKEFSQVFYLRPVGFYTDREGKKYDYTKEMRYYDASAIHDAAARYHYHIVNNGLSHEHARLLLPYATRQHFVVSFNLRSLFHLCDLRLKLDAEMEIRILANMLFEDCQKWAPEISNWYFDNRLGKARLSP